MRVVMATVSSPRFAIHEDEDPFARPNGSSSPRDLHDATEEEYEADDSVLTSDEILPTVEDDVENVAVLPASSPPAGKILVKVTPRCISSVTRSSRHSAVSSLPGSIPYDDSDMSPYKPMKHRPVYRDASKQMMQTTSSLDSYTSPRSSSHLREKMYGTPKSERRLLSPRSPTPQSVSTTRSSRRGTPSILQTPTKEEHPLVLLHVTVLPQAWPYSLKSMAAVLPETIIANQHLLEEKLNPTILARGLLLSHPGEEYDLLEERILESLELQTPRILKCGHYYQDDSETSSIAEDNVTIGRGENAVDCHVARDSSGTMMFDPETHCTTCHRSIGLPDAGVGESSRKWDIKVYAANGLMRSGAWAAAWKEMEKIDVEIGTWVPDQMRRQLDTMLEEEEQEALRVAQLAEEERLRASMEHHHNAATARSTVGEDLDRSYATGILTPPPDEPAASHRAKSPITTQRSASSDVPLTTLLHNSAVLIAQDRRNLVILVLSILVLFISIRTGSPLSTPLGPTPSATTTVTAHMKDAPASHSIVPMASVSTALSVSTVTVTEQIAASTLTSSQTEDAKIASASSASPDRSSVDMAETADSSPPNSQASRATRAEL